MNHQINQFTQIFNEALDLPVHEREAYVKSVCGTNPTLYDRLLDLLKSAEEASLFFSDLQENLYQSVGSSHDLTNTEILNYKVSEKLGEGGMATVYKAKRADGLYENEVALKVFDKDVHHPELAQKFEYERKILASLTHPNIAQIIDAGATPEGNPFYILEYVAGQNVLSYVQQQKLSLKQTLALFVKIAKAVQFAHQNFIIHRDLKPANVLIDTRGEPKLLDFGIAKIMDDSSLPTMQTQALMLTPDYASPEQLVGGVITAATDVYLLGLLLYELITFEKPFHSQGQNLLKIHQSRQGQKALAPLKKVKQSGLSRNTMGISGDLDTIVAKMLAYETQERYTNVQSLIEDMEALLAKQPIKARPASWSYKTKKYLKRNPAIAGLSMFIVAATLVFSLVYVININKALSKATQATQTAQTFQKKAENEAKVSKQVSGFLVDLFKSSHPENAQGKEITARNMLEKGFKKIKKAKQPIEVKTRLLITMSTTFRAFHQNNEAREAVESASLLYEKVKKPSPFLLALLYQEKGTLYRDIEKPEKAIKYFKQSIEALERSTKKSREELQLLSNVYGKLAFIYRQKRDLDKALTKANQGLKIQKQLYKNDHMETAETLFIIAGIYKSKQDYKQAEKYQRQSLSMCRKLLKGAHPGIAVNLANLAFYLKKQQRFDEAEKLLLAALDQNLQLYGKKHRSVATVYNNLGNNLLDQKKYPEALEYYQKAAIISKGLFGASHSRLAITWHNLANVCYQQGQAKKAIPYLEKAIQINTRKKNTKKLAENHLLMGKAQFKTQTYASARAHLEKSTKLYIQLKGKFKIGLANAYTYLGEVYIVEKTFSKAEDYLTQAYKLLTFTKPPELPQKQKVVITQTLKALVKLYKITQQSTKKAKYVKLLDNL